MGSNSPPRYQRVAARVPSAAYLAVGVFLAVVGTACKLAAEGDIWRSSTQHLLVPAGGLSFVVVGLLARERYRAPMMGLLLVLAGYAYLLEDVQLSTWEWLHTLGLVVANASSPMVLLVSLAFPRGRLESRIDRVAIWSALTVAFVVLPLGPLLWSNDSAGTHSLLETSGVPGFAGVVTGSGYVVALAGVVVVAVRVVRRQLIATPARRWFLAPVTTAFIAWISMSIVWALVKIGGYAIPVVDGASRGVVVLGLDFVMIAFPWAFVLSWARVDRARAAAMEALAHLGPDPDAEELAAVLRATLHDPGIRLVPWGPDVEPPTASSQAVATFLEGVAWLEHDSFYAEDALLMTAIAGSAGAVLGRRRHVASAALDAADTARRRVERDLHDGPQQRLLAVGLLLEQARADALQRGSSESIQQLDRAGELLAQAVEELRDLGAHLSPRALDDLGLIGAVQELVDSCPVPGTVGGRLDAPVSVDVQRVAFFVVAESLTNASRHAEASAVRVELETRHDELFVSIVDDGRGGARIDGSGTGLPGLRRRVETAGGRFGVSDGAGGGTVVQARIPLNATQGSRKPDR